MALLCTATTCFAQNGAKVARPATLDDLYSEVSVVDAAVSTSGRYLSVIVRRETDDTLLLVDLATVSVVESRPGSRRDDGAGQAVGRAGQLTPKEPYALARARELYPRACHRFQNAGVSNTRKVKISRRPNSIATANTILL
jgi:hypothetical protein